MKQLKLAINYKNDLVNSQNSPLLIELNKKDLSHFNNQLSNNTKAKFSFLVAQKIYDDALSNSTTNIIAIDGDDKQGNSFCLLESLLGQLGDEIKDIKNISTLKETLKTAASVATGGLLNEFVSNHLEKGVEYVFEGVGAYVSQLLVEIVRDKVNVSNFIIESIEGFIQDTAGDSLGDFIANASNHQLHLSSIAKTELNDLSKGFAKSGSHDVFQLTFKILLAISLESPKLIYINNPHKLDGNSLAIISLLLSYAKHEKDNDKHVGISVVYTYSDESFQPYCDVSDDLKEKQLLLDNQRRFAQRYAMLERPSSDMPKVAVKSSLFVGRVNELSQLQANFDQRDVGCGLTVSVVSGEPGIGKTALVNKHLKQIETNKMIKLTLLNEVGHSSSNTGLSSLEKSILEEAKRLALLKGWKDKSKSALKGLATQDNAFKVIGAIFNGADKVLGIAATAHERFMVDSDLETIKQSGLGDLDNKPNNQKEEQFDKLDKAINALLPLSEPSLPLVLFIDDCQWIDNNSCEYILTRLANLLRLSNKVPLYIVTTVRPSDAATLLKQQAQKQKLNEYSIALLKAIETNGHQDIISTVDVSAFSHSTVNLTGFDKNSLNELISLVVKGEKAQKEALTNTILSEVAGRNATTINTLFAIETINMLCDEKLYSENKTTPLIIGGPLRINSDISDISVAIKETFAILQLKYKDSLSHYKKSSGQAGFSLMAYAILEERLHLLKLYFAEHGNAAVNTLVFSSLLGAPFSSDIVKKSLQALAETENLLLSPLKNHIKQNKQEVGLTTEHYAIIDEVYEILSRYSLGVNNYQYSHALLHIFLDKQLEHLLDTLLIEETTQAIDQVLELILVVINQEEEQQVFYGKPEQSLNNTDYDLMLLLKLAEQHILRKGFEINPNIWTERYSISLINVALSYQNNNQQPDAFKLEEESLSIKGNQSQCYETFKAWNLTKSINDLAIMYQNNNRLLDAIKLFEEVLSIRIALYQNNPLQWAGQYSLGLNNLATCFHNTNQLTGAIKVEEHAREVLKCLYISNKPLWGKSYAISLNRLARSYYYNNQLPEAIKLSEESMGILKPLYQDKQQSMA